VSTVRRFAADLTAIEADTDLVLKARHGDANAFRTIMRRNNQRLYRIARGVVRNDAEAEDIVQEAYLRAFAHLEGFRGDATLATWLSRITLNEALGRLRRQRRQRRDVSATVSTNPQGQVIAFPLNALGDDPERTMAQRQILQLVERATDNLPEVYRVIFVARVIEGLTVEETAELFGLQAATVKTRLHRARALLRKELDAQIGPVLLNAFPFAGQRCDRLTAAVMRRLALPE
jgi:RNA polymerase sigma-70 factor (ECF subfamily)